MHTTLSNIKPELISFRVQCVQKRVEMTTYEKIQKFKEYFLRIQRDDAEIDHFWFWHAGKMMT